MICGDVAQLWRRGARRWAIGCVGVALVVMTAAGCESIGTESGGSSNPGPGNSTARGPAGCPTLHPGDSDSMGGQECVRALQEALHYAGYPHQVLNGKYDPATKANVVDFQKSHGLSADGIVGQKTWEALHSGSGGGSNGPATLTAGCAPTNPAKAECPITGTGFAPGERVRLDYTMPNGDGFAFAVTADGQGRIEHQTTLPVKHTGPVRVDAKGQQSGRTASVRYVQTGTDPGGPATLTAACAPKNRAQVACPITGSGFTPGETVDVTYDFPAPDGARTLQWTANADGEIGGGLLHAIRHEATIHVQAVGRRSHATAQTRYVQQGTDDPLGN